MSDSGIWLLFRMLDAGLRFHQNSNKDGVDLVLQQLKHYSARFQDWKHYANFSDLHYTRNLVDDNDMLEMIVLCWNPGQESRIHNHGDSDCFMVVLEGEIVEKRFAVEGSAIDAGTCPNLSLISETKLAYGSDAVHIHDKLGVHAVGNATDKPAVTLHVYTPPIKRVKVFEPENNKIVIRTPGFFSVHGRKTGKD